MAKHWLVTFLWRPNQRDHMTEHLAMVHTPDISAWVVRQYIEEHRIVTSVLEASDAAVAAWKEAYGDV